MIKSFLCFIFGGSFGALVMACAVAASDEESKKQRRDYRMASLIHDMYAVVCEDEKILRQAGIDESAAPNVSDIYANKMRALGLQVPNER